MLKYIKQKVDSRRLAALGAVSEDFIRQHDEPVLPVEGQEPTTPIENWHKHPVDFKYTFNLEGTAITVIFTNVTEDKQLFKYTFDISKFNLAENTIYTVNPWTLGKEEIDAEALIDLSALTYSVKDKIKYFAGKSFIKFISYKNSPTINDIAILLIEPCDPSEKYVGYGLEYNMDTTGYAKHNITVDGTGIDETSYVKTVTFEQINDIFSDITTTSSKSGDVITVNVTTDPRTTTLYLDTSTGNLPKKNIALNNGVGSFKIITTGLDTGDTVEVKIGFKNWSNRVTFTETL